MGRLLSLTAAAALVAGASAQCTPLGDAVGGAGLTSLAEAVTGVAATPGAEPLLAAVAATEPVEDPITIFAPTNDAFGAISDVVDGLSPEQLVAVLANHVVPSEANAEAITAAVEAASPEPASFPTLGDASLQASMDGEALMVSPADSEIMATVIQTDIETCAGIVHVVDMVLVPAGAVAMAPGPAAMDCIPLGEAATSAGLTSLVETVTAVADQPGAAAIIEAVNAMEPVDMPLTLFAPTNEAFEAIADVTGALSPEEIVAVLANHVVLTELDAAAITEAIAASSPATLETYLGATLEASLEGEDVMVTPSGTEITAMVITTDVMTCAGVVHVVDMVLVPAADVDLAVAPIAVTTGLYTTYPGQDYIPESATGNATLVEIEDIGVPQGYLVEDEEGCQAECDALPGCNAASFYIELIEDTQTNCFLKTIGDACMLPADAIQDSNAIFSLKCDAMAPTAVSPLGVADGPIAADSPAGVDGTPTIDRDGIDGDDLDVDEDDDADSAGGLGVSIAALTVVAAAALL